MTTATTTPTTTTAAAPTTTPTTLPVVTRTEATPATATASTAWGRGFDPDRLASLELRMWKAYYRRQPVRLAALLVQANREQAHASWPRALAGAFHLVRAAAGFGRSTGDYDRFLPGIVRGYRSLGLPPTADADVVARNELRWWVVRREIGPAAGAAAGEVIADLYASIYGLPRSEVAEAGRLRGLAAEVRDRGAAADPDGPGGPGRGYWPEVARLLRGSYRSLASALGRPAPAGDATVEPDPSTVGAAANDYAFVTTWRLPATREEIADILSDAAGLGRWWPAVYLDVSVVEPGDADGVGRVVELYTKGWLPYTLRWRFRVTESNPPAGFAIEAHGDFVGRGVWTLREVAGAPLADGPVTDVEYDWRIRAEKGVLRRFSFLMKPIFAANHRWAMARGEESIRLELARRRAAGDPAILSVIPAPPSPTFPHNFRRRARS
jgi:hypothetical protein